MRKSAPGRLAGGAAQGAAGGGARIDGGGHGGGCVTNLALMTHTYIIILAVGAVMDMWWLCLQGRVRGGEGGGKCWGASVGSACGAEKADDQAPKKTTRRGRCWGEKEEWERGRRRQSSLCKTVGERRRGAREAPITIIIIIIAQCRRGAHTHANQMGGWNCLSHASCSRRSAAGCCWLLLAAASRLLLTAAGCCWLLLAAASRLLLCGCC